MNVRQGDKTRVQALATIARFIGGSVALVGIAALAGWVFGYPLLTTVINGRRPMAISSATGLLLAGVALVLGATKGRPEARAQAWTQVTGALIALGGLVRLGLHLVDWGAPIADRLFLEAIGDSAQAPARMAPGTALNFLLLGAALLLLPSGRRAAYQPLLLIAGLVGCLGLISFTYGGALSAMADMAFPTAAAFVLLSVGALALRPDLEMWAVLFSPGIAGAVLRYLLPISILVPLIVGALHLEAQRRGWLGLEAGTGLGVLAIVIVYGALAWTAAVLLNRTERTRQIAEQATRESEEQYRALVAASADFVWSTDRNGQVVEDSPTWRAFTGQTSEQQKGAGWADAVHPDDRAKAVETWTRAQQERIPFSMEYRVRHVDGDWRWTYVRGVPLFDEDGGVRGWVGMNSDITERVRATAALRQSEARKRAIVDSALDAIITMDHQGHIVDFNPSAERIFGHRAADVIGRSLGDCIVPLRLRADHAGGLFRHLASGESSIFGKRLETAGLRADGSEVPLELTIVRTAGLDGPIFTGFLRDITERRQADSRVQDQLNRLGILQRISRSIGERQDLGSILAVVVETLEEHLPLDFCCTCLYDEIGKRLSVTGADGSGAAPCTELASLLDGQIPTEEGGLAKYLQDQLVYEPDVRSGQHPFGEKLARAGLHSLVAAPLMEAGRVFGILIAARQSSGAFTGADCEFMLQLAEHIGLAAQQSRLHESVRRAYDDLRQTQEAMVQQERLRAFGQMASGVAHDINNAIAPVALYVDALLEQEPNISPRGRQRLETIQHAVDDVAATVSRMREFYRERTVEVRLGSVQLNQLVRQVIEMARARWSDMPLRGGIVIDVQTDLAADLPFVKGLDGEIRNALINLIFNAVDAMPVGGTLTIRTCPSDDGQQGCVAVTDTGIGMDDETRRRCLEPFFTTKGERGTGLGLAVVYGVVQRHGASVTIESAVGKGTTVRLLFPAAAGTSVPLEPPKTARVAAGPLPILVIDDDPAVLNVLSDTLRLDGHTITSASGGEAGIEAFRQAMATGEPFALVLTDLGMPFVDGGQVAKAIKNDSPSTPVILLTGWGHRLTEEGSVPPHVNLVLNKPSGLRELREAISSCFGE